MVNQTIAAIIAIAVIIPLSSFAILNSAHSLELIGNTKQNQKIAVLASFYPLYEFTKEVGGNKVDVSLIIPSGVEPHDWEPTIQDLQKMQQADLIVINGIGFESWIEDIKSINSGALIVDTSKGIFLIGKEEIPEDHQKNEQQNENTFADPHIWLNPVLAKHQVDNIAQALAELDPFNEKYYIENAESYKNKLGSLDSKIRTELSSCDRDFIAFHNAFSYFTNQYGLHQHAILSSGDPHEDPTSKNLEKIINLAKQLNITVIFTEEAVDTRVSQVIADEIGGRVLTLSTLEVIDPSESYIEKMEQNLQNLKESLCN